MAIQRVMFVPEALAALRSDRYDLVLVNRRIFADDSDGLDLVTAMQADPTLAKTPVMMVSNFPDAQQRAVDAGARPGFGKAELNHPATFEKLARYLPAAGSAAGTADGGRRHA